MKSAALATAAILYVTREQNCHQSFTLFFFYIKHRGGIPIWLFSTDALITPMMYANSRFHLIFRKRKKT